MSARRLAPDAAATLGPILDAAEARWQTVGQPVADNLRSSITRVEAEIERDDLAKRRQYLASVLDHRTRPAAPIERHTSPQVGSEMDRGGLGL